MFSLEVCVLWAPKCNTAAVLRIVLTLVLFRSCWRRSTAHALYTMLESALCRMAKISFLVNWRPSLRFENQSRFNVRLTCIDRRHTFRPESR
jgi:hypothetical protein